MARKKVRTRLDLPAEARRSIRPSLNTERFGQVAERFTRFMGTPNFLIYLSVFIALWASWNFFGPTQYRWDPYPWIFLNLMLSLQASYAAPLILLAQNRQADRDRVQAEEDRARDERNLADTEYLTREIVSLRMAVNEMATRDFVRSELRDLLEELLEQMRREDDSGRGDSQR
jgi:uncharacterized membrane protein